MRCAVILLCLVGCARTPGTRAPAPDVPPAVLAVTAPQHIRGEEMAWAVWWQGVEVGKAVLVTGTEYVRASFRTGTLASAIANLRYDMTTQIDRGRPRSTTEVTSRRGNTDRFDTELHAASFTLRGQVPRPTPDGQPLHTLTSALGVVRAWSQATAPQGYLWFVHGGELYRLDVFPPVRDEAIGKQALRIDAVVRSIDRSTMLDVSIWLARNADRVPLRFVVQEGADRVSAELVESTASFD